MVRQPALHDLSHVIPNFPLRSTGGIEECAWVFELYRSVRFVRWLGIFAFTVQRMLFCPNVIPSCIIFMCPSIREFVAHLSMDTKINIGSYMVFMLGVNWIKVVLREFCVRRYILADRKHFQQAGWRNWCILLTPFYIVVEQVSLIIFFTLATWAMLWRAFAGYSSIVYVVAPKALHEEPSGGKKEKKAA
jgi:hypothetical protein